MMKTRCEIKKEIDLKHKLLDDERLGEDFRDMLKIQIGTLCWVIDENEDDCNKCRCKK